MGGDDELGTCEVEVSIRLHTDPISHLIWIKVDKRRTSGETSYSRPREHHHSIVATLNHKTKCSCLLDFGGEDDLDAMVYAKTSSDTYVSCISH